MITARVLRRVSPEARVRAASIILDGSLIAWPITQFTIAKDEPPFVLGLSWLALIATCIDIVINTDIRVVVETDE